MGKVSGHLRVRTSETRPRPPMAGSSARRRAPHPELVKGRTTEIQPYAIALPLRGRG